MSLLRLEVTQTGGVVNKADDHVLWVSVADDQGKPVTDLKTNNFKVATLQKAIPTAADIEVEFAHPKYGGFYEVRVRPSSGNTWEQGQYVLGLTAHRATLVTFYPPQLLGSDDGQALVRVSVT